MVARRSILSGARVALDLRVWLSLLIGAIVVIAEPVEFSNRSPKCHTNIHDSTLPFFRKVPPRAFF